MNPGSRLPDLPFSPTRGEGFWVLLGAALLFAAPRPVFAGIETQALRSERAFWSLSEPIPFLLPGFSLSQTDQIQGRLLDLLEDPDPSIRKQAARVLKEYVPQSDEVREKLRDIVENLREQAPIRKQAIKSLSWGLFDETSREKLLSRAQDPGESDAIRVIALKALYAAAAYYPVQDALLEALQSSSEASSLRKASAWALFAGLGAPQVRQALMRIAEDKDSDAGLRTEALKSLVGGMFDPDVASRILNLAQDESLSPDLRRTAILCLQAANDRPEVVGVLQKIASEDPSSILRQAAIQALRKYYDIETIRFFHLAFYRGQFVDPLDPE